MHRFDLVSGLWSLSNGGARRDRTADLRLAKPALSQLSYSPDQKTGGLRPAKSLYLMCGASRQSILLSSVLCSLILVGLGGFEPPTSPLSGVRSNHLSYRPIQEVAGRRLKLIDRFSPLPLVSDQVFV